MSVKTLGWITSILSLISLLSCIYVCISIKLLGYEINPFNSANKDNASKKKRISITPQWIDIIFWLCVTDGFYSISLIINWFPQLLNAAFPYNDKSCVIIGIYTQYFMIQSPCWHILLAYNLSCLLKGYQLSILKYQKPIQYIVVILISGVSTIIPVIYNDYGLSSNILQQYNVKECWLQNITFQMIFVGLCILCILVHSITLMYTCTKITNDKVSTKYYISMIKRMTGYITIYFILRFFPVIERIYQYHNTPPIWLLSAQRISVSMLGIGNGFVWTTNRYLFSNELRKNTLDTISTTILLQQHPSINKYISKTSSSRKITLNAEEISEYIEHTSI